MKRWIAWPLLGMVILFFVLGEQPVQAQPKTIILATTTSTQDSGLLDVLIPVFEKKTGYSVKTIAVGSGQAMAMGQKGEADVLLVHSPEAEEKFVAEGYGVNRRIVMHNDFILVGSPEDPARIKGMKSSSESFKKIASEKAFFMSRGDNSGTSAKEKAIWKAAGINPEGEKWYQQTGLGMGQTLNVASEKRAYTLSDRGTYLALRKNLEVHIMVEGDAILRNVYHVIEVNPSRWTKINASGAGAFSGFLVSNEARGIIRTFGVDRFGSPLFFSDAGMKKKKDKSSKKSQAPGPGPNLP